MALLFPCTPFFFSRGIVIYCALIMWSLRMVQTFSTLSDSNTSSQHTMLTQFPLNLINLLPPKLNPKIINFLWVHFSQ